MEEREIGLAGEWEAGWAEKIIENLLLEELTEDQADEAECKRLAKLIVKALEEAP